MYVIRVCVGLLLLTYGLVKLTIGALQFVIPKSVLASHTFFAKLIDNNPTMSDIVIDVGLMIFGVYSILSGLHILNIIDVGFIHSRAFVYAFYLILGVSITVFYYLLIYTDLPIPHKENDMVKYKIGGLVGGLIFILTFNVYFLSHHIADNGIKTITITMILSVLSILLLLGTAIYISYNALSKESRSGSGNTIKNVADQVMPLGVLAEAVAVA